jgi:hypothetical protein
MRSAIPIALIVLETASPALLPVEVCGQSVHEVTPPLVVLTGKDSHVRQLAYVRIDSSAKWKKVWLRHLGLSGDTIHRSAFDIDLRRCVVIAIFDGQSVNKCGFRVESVRDVGETIVVRFEAIGFQTGGPDGGAKHVTPYAFIVLPKTEKEIVLEVNDQSLKVESPVWKEVARLPQVQ